jgi:hypothetical protein
MLRLLFLPFRVGMKTGAVSAKVGYRSARLVGFRRLFVLGIGVGIGLLMSEVPGRRIRESIRGAVAGGVTGGVDLGERVRFELSHSPRTWHLPQPSVDIEGATVVLKGEVPHATAKADLEAAATTVPGVTTVENLLEISGTNGRH